MPNALAWLNTSKGLETIRVWTFIVYMYSAYDKRYPIN